MNTKSNKQYITMIFMVITGCCFTICASYPGFMSPDTFDQYNQAKTDVYTDWHPPVMAWIWSKLLWIKDGPQPMLFLINIIYWLAVFLFASKLKRFLFSLLFIVLSFSPPLIDFIGVIWKDTLLFATLYLQCALLFFFHDLKLTTMKKLVLITTLFTLSFLAIAARHNAAAALVPLMGLPLFLYFKFIKFWQSIIIGLALTTIMFIISTNFNKLLCNKKSSHPEQQLMLYDLLGISYDQKVLLLPDYLKKKISIDTLPQVYSPCDGAMYPFFGLNCIATSESQFDSLKSIWISAVRKNPCSILKHKFNSFSCLQTNAALKTFTMIMPNDKGFKLNNKNIFRDYFVKITNNQYADKLYSGWIYSLGCSLILALSIRHYKNKQIPIVLSIALSGLLYSLTYLALSPCNDFRYHYWTIGAMFISFALYVDSIFLAKSRR